MTGARGGRAVEQYALLVWGVRESVAGSGLVLAGGSRRRYATPRATPVWGCPVVNEEAGDGYAEGVRDVEQCVEGGGFAAVLKCSDCAGVDADLVGEAPLREALGAAQTAETVSDLFAAPDGRRAVGAVWHSRYACGFMIHCRCT